MKDFVCNIFVNSLMIGYLWIKINWNIVMVLIVVFNMKILIESLVYIVLYYNIIIKIFVDCGKIIVYNCIFNFFIIVYY